MDRAAVFAKDSGGFTMTEMVMVIAVIATLALTVLPLVQDKITSARMYSAKSDVKNVGAAIAGFYQDTGEYPTRKGAEKNKIELLRSTADSSVDPEFVPEIPVRWNLTEIDTINNHLLIDKPGGTPKGYKDNNVEWDGPYIADLGTDPWGRNYLIIAKGFYDGGTDTSPIYAWIISGGPNETIETDIDSEELNSNPAVGKGSTSDDIGLLLFSHE